MVHCFEIMEYASVQHKVKSTTCHQIRDMRSTSIAKLSAVFTRTKIAIDVYDRLQLPLSSRDVKQDGPRPGTAIYLLRPINSHRRRRDDEIRQFNRVGYIAV